MQVTEIYRSLQGESSYAGLPCIFVRLTGCNLRCRWCDSEYAFAGGQKMSPQEVIAEVQRLAPGGLVEITGGEPMLQEREAVPLMEHLGALGYTVLIETSGERPLQSIPNHVVKIVDVKCPDSGEGGTFSLGNLKSITQRDEVKFVLASRADYEFARDFVNKNGLERSSGCVLFSPAFRKEARGERDISHCLLDPQDLAGWILEDKLDVRMGLQIHKLVWAPETKGV